MEKELIRNIDEAVKDLFMRLQVIKDLVYKGSNVEAYNKLKGSLVKCLDLHKQLEGMWNEQVADESVGAELPEETSTSGHSRTADAGSGQ